MRIVFRLKRLCCLLVLAALLCAPLASVAEAGAALFTSIDFTSRNPLLEPKPVTHVETKDKFLNILILGTDLEEKDYAVRGGDSHTDAIMVVSLNQTTGVVSLVSIPRDTFTYVPGFKGIYKINASINVGGGNDEETHDKTPEGFRAVCDAVSWVLGGITLDYYCSVDFNVMKTLGDAIGGVDMELDKGYTDNGRIYKGVQHLDGKWMLAYMRARHNAERNDIGRTSRQRAVIMAVLQKLKADPSALAGAISALPELSKGLYTNMDMSVLLSLIPTVMGMDMNTLSSYVIDGAYQAAMNYKYHFIDQTHRKEVIQTVFGVEADELAYVSRPYAKWLYEEGGGFTAVRYLALADKVIAYISAMTAEQLGSITAQTPEISAFVDAYTRTKAAFELTADTLDSADKATLKKCRNELKAATIALAKLVGDKEKLQWQKKVNYYDDPLINEVRVNFR